MVAASTADLRTIRVVGAAIIEGDRCLAARRAANTSNALLWEFPGGKVESGESPEDALARELREELDLAEVTVGEFLARGRARVGEVMIILDVYRVEATGQPTLMEHSEYGWFDAEGLSALSWAEADLPGLQAVIDALGDTPPST